MSKNRKKTTTSVPMITVLKDNRAFLSKGGAVGALKSAGLSRAPFGGEP